MTGDTAVLITHLFMDIMMVSTILTGGTVGMQVIDMVGILLTATEVGGVIRTDTIIGDILTITITTMATDIVTIITEEEIILVEDIQVITTDHTAQAEEAL